MAQVLDIHLIANALIASKISYECIGLNTPMRRKCRLHLRKRHSRS
jgi:hypothetical protein